MIGMNRPHQLEAACDTADEALPLDDSGAVDFAAVLERFESPLLRYVSHLLGPRRRDAEDIVQEAFIRLHRHIHARGESDIRRLSTWLYRVAHNLVIDTARKKAARVERVDGQAVGAVLDGRAGEVADAVSELARREACQAAMDELAGLPEMQRRVVLLKIIEGMTMKQIAEVVGTTPPNICYHLHQGLAALAGRLKKRGVT